MKEDKKKIIVLLCGIFAICAMALGYALLSSSLKINGTGTISTNWDILFTNIEEKSSKGATTNDSRITDKLTATFDVDIEAPGNYIEYNVTIKNNGNMDAVIESVNGIVEANNTNPRGIQFKLSGIRIGDDLLAGDEKTFVVRAEIPSSETTLPSGTKTLDLKVNVRQKDIDSSGLVTTFKDCFQTNEAGDTITKYLCGKENTNGYSEILDVTIPSEINGITITMFDVDAFRKKGLQTVVLPNTVTTIGDDVFRNNNLEHLHLPNSVKTIGQHAFANNQLIENDFPTSVDYIGDGAFFDNQMPLDQAFIYNRKSDGTEDRTSLNSYAGAYRENITIPDEVTTIDSDAFFNVGIHSISLSDHLKSIGSRAFWGNHLTQILLPETIESIGDGAFTNNKLSTLIIPSNVKMIYGNAFNQNQLSSVEFKGAVPTILGKSIFENNPALMANTIKVPTGMTEQYKSTQGKNNNILYSSSQTWFGQDDESLLDAFYE